MARAEGGNKLLILEPLYSGSHKKMIDTLIENIPKDDYTLITMSGRKWHWRARSSALYLSRMIPLDVEYKVIFSISVLPLADLLGIRPDLIKSRKIVYFHENQLVFPVQVTRERDFQYGYNEILTCMAADKVLFNSYYNRDSFLSNIQNHLKLQPDYNTYKDLEKIIEAKSSVVYYPLDLSMIDSYIYNVKKNNSTQLHIIWPHRWEFDKNPNQFCRVMKRLYEEGCNFKLSILGESFTNKPDVFRDLADVLGQSLADCEFVTSLDKYYSILKSADVVVSTAIHEFFGVAVMEAVYCGCIPVVPNRLSYVELYKNKVTEMYETEFDLCSILTELSYRKKHGNLNKSYRHLALPFKSNLWYDNVSKYFNLS